MKRDFAHTASRILEAYGSGKTVLRKTLNEEFWHEVNEDEHRFDFNKYVYIIPNEGEHFDVMPQIPLKLIAKSEYRPYYPHEVLSALEEHGWKVRYHNAVYTVQSADQFGKIWIGDKWHKNTEQGFAELTWYDDDTPYGALKNTLC